MQSCSCAPCGLAGQPTLADSRRAEHDGEARDRIVGEERVEPAQLGVASEDPRSARVDDRCRQRQRRHRRCGGVVRSERGAHQLVGRLRRRQAEVVREHLSEPLVAPERFDAIADREVRAHQQHVRLLVLGFEVDERLRGRDRGRRRRVTEHLRPHDQRGPTGRAAPRRSSTHAHSSPARNGSERIVVAVAASRSALAVILCSSPFGALDRENRRRDVDRRAGRQLECVPAPASRHDVGHAREQRSELRDHGRQVARPRRGQAVRPEDVGELVPVDRPGAERERGEDDPSLAAREVGGLEARAPAVTSSGPASRMLMLTDAKPTTNPLPYGHRTIRGEGEPVVIVDDAKLEAFMGQALGDLGAAISGLMVYLGDQLGLYKAMAGAGPVTPAALAATTGTDERYVREWLDNQAAGGYVTYDATSRTYELPPEQTLALADEDSPAFLPGGFTGIVAAYVDADTFVDAFRTGRGVGWHEHDGRLFLGTERLFRPGYKGYLVSEWIPKLDGVEGRLRSGATVADVGCGHGASTILMAQAYPASRFVGYDYHEASIDTARRRREAGWPDRVRFESASAKDYPQDGYDLITFFDCLHDMGDPVGAAVHARRALSDGGAVMLVEPFAGDHPEDNHNPVGRAFYGFSTVVCTMASRAQEVGLALGAQAGEARLREIFEQAGFSSFRRATETPMNIVFEARV